MDVFQQAIEDSRRKFEAQKEARRIKELKLKKQKEQEIRVRREREAEERRKHEEEERAAREERLMEEYAEMCRKKKEEEDAEEEGEEEESEGGPFAKSMNSQYVREVEDIPWTANPRLSELTNNREDFNNLNALINTEDPNAQSIAAAGKRKLRQIESIEQISNEQKQEWFS